MYISQDNKTATYIGADERIRKPALVICYDHSAMMRPTDATTMELGWSYQFSVKILTDKLESLYIGVMKKQHHSKMCTFGNNYNSNPGNNYNSNPGTNYMCLIHALDCSIHALDCSNESAYWRDGKSSITKDDTITVQVDYQECEIHFYKNGVPIVKCNIPRLICHTVTLTPVVQMAQNMQSVKLL